MSAALVELSNALAQATERTAASLVAVHTESRGSSSGIIWRSGVIVTAEHALRRDEEIQVTLPDSRIVPAALAGRDASTDIAVLKCAEAVGPASITTDLGILQAGSLALAVGRTRASGPVAALGVVSLASAERRAWTGTTLAPYVRLDVVLQPTAVGGAVVDSRGQVSGMVTPRFGRFGAVLVPATLINRVADTLLEKGRIPRGYLGVGLQPVRLPESLRQALSREQRTGAIVLEVEPNGPAQKAGVVIGDILVGLAGTPVTRLEDVYSQLHSSSIGKQLAAKIVRGGALQELNLTVGERSHGE
jgi:S1-C subfamily serine protease